MNISNEHRLYACAAVIQLCAAYMALTPPVTSLLLPALAAGAAAGHCLDFFLGAWDRIDLREPGTVDIPPQASLVYLEGAGLILGAALALDDILGWSTQPILLGMMLAIAAPALLTDLPAAPGSGMSRLPKPWRVASKVLCVVIASLLAIAIPVGILAWFSFVVLTGHSPFRYA